MPTGHKGSLRSAPAGNMPEADSGALAFIAYLIVQRLSELVLSRRNTAAALARGATETGAGHYAYIIALHVIWIAAIATFGAANPVDWRFLAVFALLQALRVSTIVSLGERWTTRIIVDDAPLVRTGLYRWLRHPNYWVVVAEIFVAPMVLGLPWIAIGFCVPNAVMIAIRMRAEDRALASKRDK